MSEGQMILLFCGIYSGALSVVIYANLVALKKAEYKAASLEKYKQGA